MGNRKKNQQGFVLITTMMLLGLLLALLGLYFTTTNIETATTRYSKNSASGFYSSEAGLNLRAESIRNIFVGYNRPTGSPPTTTNPCSGSNMGSADFACTNYSFNTRSVKTYVSEDAANPFILTIPHGERYQNLNAQEYRYTAKSLAVNSNQQSEAELQLRFKSRLVPLFQFAAFYNKDLEILPGPVMTLSGPIHTNGDLYLYSNSATLSIAGQVTTGGDVYRGRKDGSISPTCNNNAVNIMDPNAYRALTPTCPSRHQVTSSEVVPFNNMIQFRVAPVTVPAPEVLDPTPGQIYWSKADLRLVLALDASNNPTGFQVRAADDTVMGGATAQLNTCAGILSGKVVSSLATSPCNDGQTSPVVFKNYRENKCMRILDVDTIGLLNCLKTTNWFGTGKVLSDSTEGGLVFHMTVKGPNSAAAANSYGVRLQNAATLQATAGGAPLIKGLTIVSDQAVYLKGDYNRNNKIPAAILADSINVLSGAWSDTNSTNTNTANRQATATIINAAFLAGTDSTGGVEGAGGQGGAYNGGLENYPRFHERWTGVTLTYRGSFVSLGKPRHVNGAWGAQSYNPPNRDWNYDTSFNNAANLPPITPRFVYLRQELFVRDFEKDS